MRIALVTFIAVALLGCTDNIPMSPSECDDDTVALVGSWDANESHQSGTYSLSLNIRESATDCAFSYLYRTYRDVDSTLVYESRGDIYVTAVETFNDLTRLTIEGQRTYTLLLDHHGDEVISGIGHIFDTSTAKIWGDVLYMWKSQFIRRPNAP